jgi:hypothetical protein
VQAKQVVENIRKPKVARAAWDTKQAQKRAVRDDIATDRSSSFESFESVSGRAPTWAVTKKEAKNFTNRAELSRESRAQYAKVFCFFFKKEDLLAIRSIRDYPRAHATLPGL